MDELIARGCHPEECYDLEMWLLKLAPIQLDKYSFPEVKPKESWMKKIKKKFKKIVSTENNLKSKN
jgi:hypothetical protein